MKLKKFNEITSDYPYPYPYPKTNGSDYPNVSVDYPSKKAPVRFKMNEASKPVYPYPNMPDVTDAAVSSVIEMCSKADVCPIMALDDFPDNYLEIAGGCNTAKDAGCPLFLKCFSDKVAFIDIGWQEIFEIDDSKVLDVIINNFNSIKNLVPPIVLGHDEGQAMLQASGYPSAGWISEVKRKEASNVLMAKFSRVPPEIVKLIESKSYSKVSAELYVDYIDGAGKHYGPTLRRVAILGADVPHIKSLADLCVIYNTEDLPTKTFFMEDNMELKQAIEELKVKSDTIIKLQEDAKANEQKVLAITKLQEDAKVSEQKVLALSEQLVAANQKLTLAADAIASTRKTRILDELNVKFTPAVVEDLSKLLTFAEDDVALKVIKLFEMHTEKGTLVKPAKDKPIIPTEPMTASTPSDPIAGLHGRIIAFAEEKKIAYEDAYNLMSRQGLVKI